MISRTFYSINTLIPSENSYVYSTFLSSIQELSQETKKEKLKKTISCSLGFFKRRTSPCKEKQAVNEADHAILAATYTLPTITRISRQTEQIRISSPKRTQGEGIKKYLQTIRKVNLI